MAKKPADDTWAYCYIPHSRCFFFGAKTSFVFTMMLIDRVLEKTENIRPLERRVKKCGLRYGSFIGPLIDKVMNTGEPVWFEDQLVPIYRNGKIEDVWWTFSYSAVYGDDEQIYWCVCYLHGNHAKSFKPEETGGKRKRVKICY